MDSVLLQRVLTLQRELMTVLTFNGSNLRAGVCSSPETIVSRRELNARRDFFSLRRAFEGVRDDLGGTAVRCQRRKHRMLRSSIRWHGTHGTGLGVVCRLGVLRLLGLSGVLVGGLLDGLWSRGDADRVSAGAAADVFAARGQRDGQDFLAGQVRALNADGLLGHVESPPIRTSRSSQSSGKNGRDLTDIAGEGGANVVLGRDWSGAWSMQKQGYCRDLFHPYLRMNGWSV